MKDIAFCLIIAAARYTLTCQVAITGEDWDTVREFLYHPSMCDNSDIAYMYGVG